MSTHDDFFTQQRERMVEQQIQRRGIRDPAIIAALREVPRERFVTDEYRASAYDDSALPIPAGQTISQPYVVALMIKALQLSSDDRVLEVGSGSGYAAAVLSRITSEVYAVERHEELVTYARKRLTDLGYDNVHVRHADGTMGWPEHAPYEGILVSASGPRVPQPLREQLATGGRLVMPIGQARGMQTLVRLTRTDEDQFKKKDLGGVRFVPLIGEQGW
ncbi:MAG: protein-L-isoaspartate(D-aspartate) O-methyltransferase [Candidatus Promineifilaceae bacterium]|nr:protein-L-isoaspartate(D-aspartate) O-methyltransferase [Candidatus Promineifilaceae bacterium]